MYNSIVGGLAIRGSWTPLLPFTDIFYKVKRCIMKKSRERRICKVDGCNNQHEAKGYCNKHYKKWRRCGDPLFEKYVEYCTIPGCQEKHLANGHCIKHYTRILRYDDPHYTKFMKDVEKHGLAGTPEYSSWSHIIQRCENKNNKRYSRYGGRGIIVCDRWRNSFIAFLEDMGKKPFNSAQIDRIDNDGNYEPGNCRWVTNAQNNRHTSLTKLTMQKVKEIRDKYKKGNISRKELALFYNISRGRICAVINNKAWI